MVDTLATSGVVVVPVDEILGYGSTGNTCTFCLCLVRSGQKHLVQVSDGFTKAHLRDQTTMTKLHSPLGSYLGMCVHHQRLNHRLLVTFTGEHRTAFLSTKRHPFWGWVVVYWL